MKTIKIYAFSTHQTKERTSGVDFCRVIQPMKALDGYCDGEVKFEVTFHNIHKKKQDNWLAIAKEYDLIFTNYTVLDWGFAYMGLAVRKEGKKMIMDIDDAVWHIGKDNIAHDAMKELSGPQKISCMLAEVDGITCTNRYLKNVILNYVKKDSDKIAVLSNQIDLSLYNTTHPAKDTNTITLLHFGATGHFLDQLDPEFVKGMDRIFREYPNVRFKAIGSFISELRKKWGRRYENDFGDVDIYKWISDKFPCFMEECDIMVVSLLDNIYNRSKSDVKFLESASAMKPGVFAAVRPYTDTIINGETGYLAKTSGDWYKYLKLLIDSKEERQRIGENAYDYVVANRQMKSNIKPYAEFIKKILST